MPAHTKNSALSPDDYSIVLDSPLGRLGIRFAGEQVCRLDYLSASAPLQPAAMRYRKEVAHQLERYFQDPVLQFSLPLALEGTPFQLRVWQALQAIPSGETRTYGALAQTLDSGSRAVGNACRRNPVSIIVPCHRVVSATGMGGYSGNTSDRAIWRKHWLLAHEGADCTGLKNRRLPPPSGAHRTIQRTTHA